MKKQVSLWLVTYNASHCFPYLHFTNTMNSNNYTQIKYKTDLTCMYHHCRCCLVPKVWWIITSLSLSLMQQLQKEIRIVSTSSIHNVLYSMHAPVHKLWSNCKNMFPDVCAINSEAIAKSYHSIVRRCSCTSCYALYAGRSLSFVRWGIVTSPSYVAR